MCSSDLQTLYPPRDITRSTGIKSPDSVSREEKRALQEGNQYVAGQVWVHPMIRAVEEQGKESRHEQNGKRPEPVFKSDDLGHSGRILARLQLSRT